MAEPVNMVYYMDFKNWIQLLTKSEGHSIFNFASFISFAYLKLQPPDTFTHTDTIESCLKLQCGT